MSFALDDIRGIIGKPNDFMGVVIAVNGETVTAATAYGRRSAIRSTTNIKVGSRVTVQDGVATLVRVPSKTYYV